MEDAEEENGWEQFAVSAMFGHNIPPLLKSD